MSTGKTRDDFSIGDEVQVPDCAYGLSGTTWIGATGVVGGFFKKYVYVSGTKLNGAKFQNITFLPNQLEPLIVNNVLEDWS